MGKNSIAVIIIIIIFCGKIFSSPAISSTAVKIMREIKIIYQTEKANIYIDNYLKEKNLNAEQISDVRERINYFFNSSTFIETGAAYLTALFNENDLIEIFNAAQNGNLFENNRNEKSASVIKKTKKLFSELDPYLYRYLKQNIIPPPSVSRGKT